MAVVMSELDITQATKERLIYCDFCGKDQREVTQLIAGPKVHICDECVDLSWEIVTEKRSAADALLRDILEGGT